MKDSLTVFLRDCRVMLPVGIYEHEKAQPQPVTVSVELRAREAGSFDRQEEARLARVMDYERLYVFVTETLPAAGHTPLLETLAERIAAFCLESPLVEAVTVTLEKTAIFAAAAGAGVTLTRHRKQP